VYKENKISGVTVLLTDLTEEIKLSKLKTDFVTNASHELRTPLTSVKGYSETLLNGAMEDKELREKFIRIIDKEADRLILLVEDLMNLSRIEATRNNQQKEIIDLKKIIISINDSFGIIAEEKGVNVNMDLDIQKEYFALGSEDQIKQVVANFIDNAVKYTPSGGQVNISIAEDEREFRVNVKDTGIGLSKEDSLRVFERFFRSDRSRNKKNGGFGLGLSIAKNIIESLDGKIGVESELDRGSTFWFTLKKANQL
jgi:two-component system phosphate regulon sensor histidine kinase PhoR